tara:strand:+ start:575 stop:838 length:264 start_codon:yes stop_codon:yes gene_type:complete
MAYQKLQAGRAFLVTQSDTTNIPNPFSSDAKNNGCVLYIGTGGNIRILTVGGDDIIFTNVLSGSYMPVQVLRVFETNTTASNIIALW